MYAFAEDTTVFSCPASTSCVAAHKSDLYACEMTIHKRIRERREALGLSKAALGKMLDPQISYQTIQQWEREGGTMPLRKRIQQLATALKCTVEWLETGYEAPETALGRPELANLLWAASRLKKEQIDAVTSFARLLGAAPATDVQTFINGMMEPHPMVVDSVAPANEVRHPAHHPDKVGGLGTNNLRPVIGVEHVRAKRK